MTDNVQPPQAKVYQSQGRLTVVAPMPGLSADCIDVALSGPILELRARENGVAVLNRRVALPAVVDGHAAIASYAYGVLVVVLPVLGPDDNSNPLGPGRVATGQQQAAATLAARRPEQRRANI